LKVVDSTTVRLYNNGDFLLHHVVYRSHLGSHFDHKQQAGVSLPIKIPAAFQPRPIRTPSRRVSSNGSDCGGTDASSATGDGRRPRSSAFYGSLV